MKSFIFTILCLLMTITGSAQDVDRYTDINLMPSYLITIFTGVLLALGFQFLLTSLSVAFGITAIGNLKEAYVENKYDYGHDDDDADENKYDTETSTPAGVDLAYGIGLWNVFTVAPSVFGATALALLLTPIDNIAINITLALAIWAAFFMILFYLESRAFGMLIGGLVNTAISGLKVSGQAIKSIVTPSPQSQMESMAGTTIEKLRKEFSAEFDSDGIVQTLDNFVNKVNRKIPDYNSLKEDLMEIAAAASNGGKSSSPAKWTAIQTAIQTAIMADTSRATAEGKEKAQQLQSLLADMKTAYQEGNTPKEGLKKALAVSPIDEEKANNYLNRIRQLLLSATPEGMDPNQLQREIEKIIDNPAQTVNGLREKLNSLDRTTIIDLLNNNTSLDKAQLEKYADQAESILAKAKSRLGLQNISSMDDLMASFEHKVARFIDSTDNDELDYALLKNDFRRAMNNPSDSLDIVKRRLSTFNRDTLVSLITNTGLVSRKDINQVVDSITGAREEVMGQIGQIENKARQTMVNLERKAVIQAEAARQSAMTAAWWLTFTIIAAAAAALGGAFVAV